MLHSQSIKLHSQLIKRKCQIKYQLCRIIQIVIVGIIIITTMIIDLFRHHSNWNEIERTLDFDELSPFQLESKYQKPQKNETTNIYIFIKILWTKKFWQWRFELNFNWRANIKSHKNGSTISISLYSDIFAHVLSNIWEDVNTK